jgi:hypothetical protein
VNTMVTNEDFRKVENEKKEVGIDEDSQFNA